MGYQFHFGDPSLAFKPPFPFHGLKLICQFFGVDQFYRKFSTRMGAAPSGCMTADSFF
jgi:hypothetical protein